MLIDTHAHLDFSQYDDDRPEVIQRAFDSGLAYIINVGIDGPSSRASVKLAEHYERIYAAVGLHPHDARKLSPHLVRELESLAGHHKVVALGEMGLDFHRNYSPREDQVKAFRKQIGLAREVRLPLIVHVREAYEEALDILEEELSSDVGGVIHCFGGTVEQAREAIELGFHVSFTGTITYPRSRSLMVAAALPLSQVLVETDCPFLAPVPHRGRRNEPAYVRYVAEELAKAKSLSRWEVMDRTSENAMKLMGLGARRCPPSNC